MTWISVQERAGETWRGCVAPPQVRHPTHTRIRAADVHRPFLLFIHFILCLYVRAGPMISLHICSSSLLFLLQHDASTDAVRVADPPRRHFATALFLPQPRTCQAGGVGLSGLRWVVGVQPLRVRGISRHWGTAAGVGLPLGRGVREPGRRVRGRGGRRIYGSRGGTIQFP